MKKWIPVALSCIVFTFSRTHAQVTADVLEPAALEGDYAHTWAAPAANSWATPDMELPANVVVDTVVQALDATAADSLMCDVAANAAAINGKIALLYRGSCDYSEKALFCQNAGAVAVVVINNIPGPPVGMGAGAVGTQVTIPVFQITQADGAAWRAALDNGTTVVALLGNKTGYYADDIGFKSSGIVLPPGLSYPELLAGDASEYSLKMGAWVFNFGQNARTGVTIGATVSQGGQLYNETSAAQDILSGDSAFFELPEFNQSTYSGDYQVVYTTGFGGTDEHNGDNDYSVDLRLGEEYALAPWDDVNNRPISTIGIQPAAPAGNYTSCVHFQDANASRIGVAGFYVYATKNLPGTMLGELLTLSVFEWQDQFTGLSDAAFAFDNIIPVSETEYNVALDSNVFAAYAPLNDPIVLQDDMRYLFCVTAFSNDIFLGYNQDVNYATNEETTVYDQPTSPNQNGASWFVGFVGDPVSSVAVRTVAAASIGIEEVPNNTVSAYPNPSSGIFSLSLDDYGPTDITVSDATGRVVLKQHTTRSLHILDLRDQAPGLYAVDIRSAKGRASGRVVVE
ncbi:MAG: PA domain-containing protein [Flavobacteriales bacterium]